MLGYFSLVGLQRVHALVGDYHGALKVWWHDDLRRVSQLVVCSLSLQMICIPACYGGIAGSWMKLLVTEG